MSEGQFKRLSIALFCGFVALGVLKILFALGSVLFFELSHPYEGDLYIFWTIGRGLLNGLLPYVDMFETKPPGIFLLSALSLGITGDHRLGYLMETVSILAPAVVCILVTARAIRKHQRITGDRQLLLLTFSLYVLFLATLTGMHSGLFKPETFGVCVVTLYGVLALTHSKPKILTVLAMAALITLGCLLKETFLFSFIACGLLVCRTQERFFTNFVTPALVAGVAGILFMLAFGYFGPYLRDYLPEMFVGRVSYWIPTWLSMFQGGMLVDRIARFSMFLAPTVVVMAALSPLWRMERGHTHMERIIVVLLFIVSTALICWGALPTSPFLNGHSLPNAQKLFLEFVIVMIAIGMFGLFIWKRNMRAGLKLGAAWLIPLASFFLTVLAFGAGGDFSKHQVGTVVPYFYLLGLLSVEYLSEKNAWGALEKGVLSLLAIMLTAGAFLLPIPKYGVKIAEQHKQMVTDAKNAVVLDSVLSACGEDRYLIVGELNGWMWVHTKHSPLGPGFYQYALNYPVSWHETNPFFTDSFKNNLQSVANVLVIDPDYGRPVPAEHLAYIKSNFTTDPWLCARDLPRPEGFQILFRRGAGPK